jgi:hypothetical protein
MGQNGFTDEEIANFESWKNQTGYQEDEGWFGQQTVRAYQPNQQNFQLGGDPNYATNRAGELSSGGYQTSNGLRAHGQAQAASLRGQGTAFTAQGMTGAAGANNRALGLGNEGEQGNALQNARALGFQSQANQGLAAGNARAQGQASGALQNQQAAQYDARLYGNRAQSALLRPDVTTQGAQLHSDNRALETQARSQQLAAAQSLGYRANDNAGQANTQGFRDFAAQTGSGPSAAQAQLQQGADQSMSSALALARSGRGNNTGAVRQALFQNAATQGQTNQQLAALRAQEFDQAQNRQLGALSAESQALQGYRGQDLQALQGAAGLLGQARGQDQAQQQLGIGQSQFDANLALQNQAQRDAAALAWAGQQQTAAGRGDQAYFQGQQLGNQSIGQAQQYALGMQGFGQQASQAGQQFELGKDQLANQAIGQGQQFQIGMAGLGNQAQGLASQYDLGAQGLANQYNLGMQGLANQTMATQLQANMGYENLMSGNVMGAQNTNAVTDQQRDAANIGMVAGGIGALGGLAALSDERSKEKITRLEGELSAAYKFLGGAPGFDRDALDDAYRRQGGEPNRTDEAETRYGLSASKKRGDDIYDLWYSRPRFDLSKTPSYSYQYKNPSTPGAGAGTHYGPMAQDLERSPATRSTVVTGPDGLKRVDGAKLALVTAGAVGEQQRDIQEIKRLLAENNGKPAKTQFVSPYSGDAGFDRDALDEAHRKSAGWY